MLRVCGASRGRKAGAARACWCHGLFCGVGGARRSVEFRREWKGATIAVSRAELETIMAQADLFDGTAKRARWRERLAAHVPPSRTRAAARSAVSSLG